MNCTSITKVLHIVEDLKVGGLEKILATIALSLDSSKYQVHVWCLVRGGDIAQVLMEKGINVRILRMESYHNPINLVRLSLEIRRSHFHLIHTHGYFAGTFGRVAAIFARVPVIIAHVHSTYFEYRKRNLLIERFLSIFTDKIICISGAVKNFVSINERISSKKTCLIYNSVIPPIHSLDKNSRERIRFSLGIEVKAVVIIIVASLTTNKGHFILLEAFEHILRNHPSIRLLIVGEGPLRNKIEIAARELMIDQAVVFTGMRQDIFNLLQASDIFVLPSQFREGLGLALIEAMAVSLPVIGTALGGISEVIENNENGFLVPPENSNQLAKALKILVNDQVLRNRMGLRGRKIYEEKFTLSRMIRQIESIYDYFLAKRIIEYTP